MSHAEAAEPQLPVLLRRLDGIRALCANNGCKAVVLLFGAPTPPQGRAGWR